MNRPYGKPGWSVATWALIFQACILLPAYGVAASQWTVWDSSNTPVKTAGIRQAVVNDSAPAWVGTYGEGLFRVQDGRWIREDRLPGDDFVLRLLTWKGELWVGTARSGVLTWDGRDWRRFSERDGLCDANVWDLLPLPDGGALFGSRYRGLSRLDSGRIRCLQPHGALPDREITCLERDAAGRVWVGTARGGLCGFLGADTIYWNAQNGLSGNYIRALLCDSVLRYVATWDGGLDKRNGEGWVREPGVKPPVVALGMAPDRAIWAGTWGHGVWRFRQGRWMKIDLPGDHPGRRQVIDIDFDARGRVYLSTSAGLFRFSE